MKMNHHKSEMMALNMEPPKVAPFLENFQYVAGQSLLSTPSVPVYRAYAYPKIVNLTNMP
jgi:hypothetical protein